MNCANPPFKVFMRVWTPAAPGSESLKTVAEFEIEAQGNELTITTWNDSHHTMKIEGDSDLREILQIVIDNGVRIDTETANQPKSP